MKEVIVDAEDLVCLNKEKLQEIIRCKDCKYYKPQFNEDGYYITNCQYSKAAEVNGFCHMARRKEDG